MTAPFSTKNCTTFLCPFKHAQLRGVSPSLSIEVKDAPWRQNSTTGRSTRRVRTAAARWVVDVWQLTFREQELHGAQVTLAGGHHEKGPALLVADVDVGAVLQQQLRDLRGREKNRGAGSSRRAFSGDRVMTSCQGTTRNLGRHIRRRKCGRSGLTCQCPCLTAQNRGETPRRLTCCTAAPCSNRKLHTSIFPRPAAAVKARKTGGEDVSTAGGTG